MVLGHFMMVLCYIYNHNIVYWQCNITPQPHCPPPRCSVLSIVHCLCLLYLVYCPLSHHSLAALLRDALYCPLSTVYCLMSTVHCLLSPVYCLLSTVYCPLSIVTPQPRCPPPICSVRPPQSCPLPIVLSLIHI